MLIPYGIGTYRRADLPRVRLVNLFAEKSPSTEGQVALMPRPALAASSVVGPGPIRGIYTQDGFAGNALMTVSGGALFNGNTNVGSIGGSLPVAMSVADAYLLIATGDALYRSDGTTTTQIAFPDGAGVVDVAYLGGYALAVRAGSRHIYFTLDTSTWDSLDYVSAEQSLAPVVGMRVVAGQLWVFSTDHVEIFYLTGDATAPIAALPGRVFDKGCAARATIALVDNTAFWCGSDRVVYRGAGSPVRVSDHGIEERIAGSQTLSAFAYTWIGHSFYGLQLDDGTYVYDAATQLWHECASYGYARWRVDAVARSAGVQTAASFADNKLWLLSGDGNSDDGAPISGEFTVLENDPIFLDNVTVNCSTGDTSSPSAQAGLIELRTSRDGGMTWGDWRQAPLGMEGRYRTRATFRRVGKVDQDNMVLHFRITDPVPRRVSEVRINDALGGRSR